MVQQLISDIPFEDFDQYPDSDGQPADNTEQFRWIVVIKENLERLFASDPDVFVASDLLWYPVEGEQSTAERQRVQALEAKLRELGIDPDGV